MPDIGHRARPVVGHAIDDHRGAVDPVTFVADLFVRDALELAGAALGGALDRVLRHVLIHRLVDREPQPRVHRRVGSAHPGGNGDFADEAREDLAPLGIGGRLLVLDVRPFAVASHGRSPLVRAESGIVAVRDSGRPNRAYSRSCCFRNACSTERRTSASLISSMVCLIDAGSGRSSARR